MPTKGGNDLVLLTDVKSAVHRVVWARHGAPQLASALPPIYISLGYVGLCQAHVVGSLCYKCLVLCSSGHDGEDVCMHPFNLLQAGKCVGGMAMGVKHSQMPWELDLAARQCHLVDVVDVVVDDEAHVEVSMLTSRCQDEDMTSGGTISA